MPIFLVASDRERSSLKSTRTKDLTAAVGKSRPLGVVIVGMKDTDPIEWVCELRRSTDSACRGIPVAIVRSLNELHAAMPGQPPQWRRIFPAFTTRPSRRIQGKLIIDQRARQVCVRGDRRNCSPQEFRLLLLFLRFPSVMFSREELLWRVSAEHLRSDGQLIDVLVSRIRRKINVGGVPAGQIWTARKLGYAFNYNENCFIDAITGDGFLAWPCCREDEGAAPSPPTITA